jgi:hypothetical protein
LGSRQRSAAFVGFVVGLGSSVEEDGYAGDFDVEAAFAEHAGGAAEEVFEFGEAFVVGKGDDELAVFTVGVLSVFLFPEAEEVGGGGGVAAEVLDEEQVDGLFDGFAIAAGALEFERWEQEADVLAEGLFVVIHAFFYLSIG